MFEKVNPQHPDKVADRIAGAIVDLCYTKSEWPKVAAEVLLGHGLCSLQIETSERLTAEELEAIVHRIAGEEVEVRALIVPQDVHLADNQAGAVRCGDNGIFRGCAPTSEQKVLTAIAHSIYERYPYDGKYLIQAWNPPPMRMPSPEELEGMSIQDVMQAGYTAGQIDNFYRNNVLKLTVCQSHANDEEDREAIEDIVDSIWPDDKGCIFEDYNPLGPWTGGTDVDCGATNRKLGSDMGDGVTGGGLHGKDLSKADVSVNIWAYLESIRTGREVTACCSIGDETVNGIPYRDIVEQARLYIHTLGGFERFAEWGLIRHI